MGQSLIQRSHRVMFNHTRTKLNHVPSGVVPKRRILSRVNEDRPLHDEQLVSELDSTQSCSQPTHGKNQQKCL